MKKLLFLLMLAVVGISTAKAQQTTMKSLFPNKETDIKKLESKPEPVSKDISTPTKQRLFQNYTQSVQKSSAINAKRTALSNTKMASDLEFKPEKTEAKTDVKLPPMQQESNNKQ